MIKRLMESCAHFLLGPPFMFVGLVLALIERQCTDSSRLPAVLLGITPIIDKKYLAQALRKQGYLSISFAYHVYSIHSVRDFDYTPERIFPRLARMNLIRALVPYFFFLWGLANFQVFILDFDGGFLRSTPYRFLEWRIMNLAGRRIIAVPYGGDALDLRRCRDPNTVAAALRDYPKMSKDARDIERRVTYYSGRSSFVVAGGNMIDFLPRFDLLVPSSLVIDTEEWQDDKSRSGALNGRPVKILHAPNHRNIKGTQFLIQACEELRAEGVPVELIIKERVPNSEIKRLMREVDIVASGFVFGFYEMFAVEGMSMCKPVMNYWRPDLKFIYSTYSWASECPIVDTPVADLRKNIKMLVDNPELRRQLGEAGRRYVEKYHSHEAIGRLFDKIIRKVWFGEKTEFLPSGVRAALAALPLGTRMRVRER